MDMNPIHAEALAHRFTPSRFGGSVCIEPLGRRSSTLDDTMPCGRPATHPVHRVDGPAEGSRERTMERRYLLRGRLQQVAVIATERGLVAAAAEIERILDEVLRIPTPAEAVTGTSDRRAAALANVAELKRRVDFAAPRPRWDTPNGAAEKAMLDVIEAALREGTGGR